MQAKQYDYIFLGAGCATLSIVMRMIASEKFSNKKILLIDKDDKKKNDRTWCFWEDGEGFFEKIVYHKWEHLFFSTDDENIPLDISPYQYKMIRGIDFYQYCFSVINAQLNIDVINGNISFDDENISSKIFFNGEVLLLKKSAYIFNSIHVPGKKQRGRFYLLQHFKGWIIETNENYFDINKATLMDFRVRQDLGTTFVYVLPLSPGKALIEYTLFTEKLLSQNEYNAALKDYISSFLKLENYKIIDEEYGVIPMTNATFPDYENGMYYIGTAGGNTKASTGYTFRFIQKQANTIVEELVKNKDVIKLRKPHKRFYFYDSTLLHILSKKLLGGKEIFSVLFKKNRASTVLKFLDNETSISEEIKLLNSLPKKIFIKAGFKELVKNLIK
ncbi:MAG: lycopene cyclase family protein [Bacteroidota bacterium]|nr:lycopene cyclase family protein [Bacteroidota bacterium]